MKNLSLWNTLEELKSDKYVWQELTHELSADTPHWHGFQPMGMDVMFDYPAAPMRVHEFKMPGQYGTHADVPLHFDPEGRGMSEITLRELAYPLCVIDKSETCATDHDYALSIADILAWEETYGKIPAGAFVAFRSDWYKRPNSNLDNRDADGNAHYPGWTVDAVKWLVEERNIGSIGHETADTDPAALQADIGFAAEDYILRTDRIQVELLKNLDLVPPVGAVIFCVFPCLKNGTGFPTRAFAIYPKD